MNHSALNIIRIRCFLLLVLHLLSPCTVLLLFCINSVTNWDFSYSSCIFWLLKYCLAKGWGAYQTIIQNIPQPLFTAHILQNRLCPPRCCPVSCSLNQAFKVSGGNCHHSLIPYYLHQCCGKNGLLKSYFLLTFLHLLQSQVSCSWFIILSLILFSSVEQSLDVLIPGGSIQTWWKECCIWMITSVTGYSYGSLDVIQVVGVNGNDESQFHF